VAGTAFGTARLVEFASSADDALLFRSVGPFHHGGDAKSSLDVTHLVWRLPAPAGSYLPRLGNLGSFRQGG
jgi:hypothetical protein